MVTAVADGCEAVDLCRSLGTGATAPDLVLLDLNLGCCTGFDVLAAIRSNPHLRSTPVLVVSTSQHRGDILRAYELCADGYMFKSADVEESFNNLRRAVKFYVRPRIRKAFAGPVFSPLASS